MSLRWTISGVLGANGRRCREVTKRDIQTDGAPRPRRMHEHIDVHAVASPTEQYRCPPSQGTSIADRRPTRGRAPALWRRADLRLEPAMDGVGVSGLASLVPVAGSGDWTPYRARRVLGAAHSRSKRDRDRAHQERSPTRHHRSVCLGAAPLVCNWEYTLLEHRAHGGQLVYPAMGSDCADGDSSVGHPR